LIPAGQASLLELDDYFVDDQGTKTGVLKLEVADAAAVVLPLPGAALPLVHCVGTLKLCAMFIVGVEDDPNIPGIRKMHEQLEEAQVELRLLQEELLQTRDAIRSIVDKLAAVDLSHAWRSVCRSATHPRSSPLVQIKSGSQEVSWNPAGTLGVLCLSGEGGTLCDLMLGKISFVDFLYPKW
jgi:hypothetical protein